MTLERTYLNRRIELFDAVYDPERQSQYDAVSRLYNRSLGPVMSVNIHRPEFFDLSMYSSSCLHSPIGALMRDLAVKAEMADTILIPGGGKGGTMQQPVLGGLGEVTERLLAVLHFQSVLGRLVFSTYEELTRRGYRALGPRELPLFAPEQYRRSDFAYVPFEPQTPLRWIEGTNLLTGESVWIPAQIVLIYYRHDPAEAHIAYPTTGGLAFHPSRRHAILHGLYEVVERDAINVRWYCRRAPARVSVNIRTLVSRHAALSRPRLSTPHIEGIEVFLNTLDIPFPILTTVAVDRVRDDRAFLGGGGAWSTKERALIQALFELGQSRTALKYYRPIGMKNIRADSDVSEMTDFFDAAVYFGYKENLRRLSWYRSASQTVSWDDVPSLPSPDPSTEYHTALRTIADKGCTPIVVDFDGACWPGVFVTKVVLPELTQACIPSHPYLGHSRFYELPWRLGFADRPLEFGELNPDPVPFP